MGAGTLIAELKRRRVFRVLVGYGLVAFALLQVIEPVMHALHLPDATLTYAVVALAAGFPVAVVLAWAFDVNEGRIERAAPAAGKLPGARLKLLLIGLGVVAAAPSVVWYFVWPGRARPRQEAPASSKAAQPSIAVLPFADMSPGKDQEYFSDGIAEEILDDLAQVDGLRVIGRTSSFSFKGKGEDLRVIGEKLGVAHVLEGSVRREGARVRITAQLIEAAGGSHVWSRTFDREVTGVFAVQEEIAKSVVEALKVKLLAGEAAGMQDRQTTPEAYAQFLLGNQLWREAAESAALMSAFEKAVVLDPAFAPAWAHLALSIAALDVKGETPAALAARHRRAMEAAEKAVALDPTLARGYAVRARLRMNYEWNWDGARSDFERALAIAPGDALAVKWYGGLLNCLGRHAEAIRLQRQAVELDPLLFTNWSMLGYSYILHGDSVLGRSAIQRALELSNFKANDLNWLMSASYVVDGDLPHAVEWAGKLKDEVDRLWASATIEQALGHREKARAALGKLIERIGAANPYSIGLQYAWQGGRDGAFEWLEKAYAARDEGMACIKFDVSPDVAPLRALRADPRYTSLLKRMNLPLD